MFLFKWGKYRRQAHLAHNARQCEALKREIERLAAQLAATLAQRNNAINNAGLKEQELRRKDEQLQSVLVEWQKSQASEKRLKAQIVQV